MNELYAEAGVKKEKTIGVFITKLVMIVVAAAALLLSFKSSVMLIIAALIIVAMVYFFPRLNVEYEYIFCDGQLDFDKILGNVKRKNALRIDFEQVEIMAPEGSHILDSYKNRTTSVKNFSSGKPGVKPYVIIYRQGQNMVKILFEPDDKMISCIKMKNQRKVSEY